MLNVSDFAPAIAPPAQRFSAFGAFDLEQLRERIVSLWGAMCTCAAHSSAGTCSPLHAHWKRSIADLGECYVVARDHG